MAVGTRDTTSCVNALAPEFKLRVLRFQDLGASLFVIVIEELFPV
jgi:hypothetical protein